MKTDRTAPESIDQYIAGFPEEIQEILQAIRATVRDAAPGAEEAIKYSMPTFTLNGNLVHFSAFKKHIGFYPVPRGVEGFEELETVAGEKSTAQFPYDKPVPYDLIRRIVKFRVGKNLEKAG
jgi:uncharacterized protein YdhG (YjbR/CyaY superfamily)